MRALTADFTRRMKNYSPWSVFFLEVHERKDDGLALFQPIASPPGRAATPAGDEHVMEVKEEWWGFCLWVVGEAARVDRAR